MKRSRKPRRAVRSAHAPTVASSADWAAKAARRTTVWHLFLLAAATLGLYASALRNGFVTDDTLQMISNPFVTSYRYIPRLFASDVWAFSGLASTTNYYRPLQMLVYMAQYYCFGFRPWPFHLVNLLAGLAVVLAVYFLLRALARSASFALCAALLFAFHPVHVEPLTWIAALPDLLCGLFLMMAMLFYHRARTGAPPLANHALGTAFFFAALFCKETAMVFPAILLAYEFLYRRESLRSMFSVPMFRRLLPYSAALGLYIFSRIRALGSFAPANAHRVTPWQNFLSVPVLFAQYVLKLFWPMHLDYYYYFVPENSAGWKFFASVLLIVALVAAMFWLRKSQPLLSFALAWFFLTLAPALSIDNVSGMVFTERYVFVPSLAVCVFGAWAWLHLTEDHSRKSVLRAAYSVAIVLLAFYIFQIERRIPVWHDDLRLLGDAARQSPLSPDVQLELGVAYYRVEQYDLAIAPLEGALVLGRVDYEPHVFLALALASLGKYDQANAELVQAYQLKPTRIPAWSVFGLAYASLHQWDQAADCYRRAAEINPNNQLMFELLGEALQRKGNLPGAMDAWRRALKLQPGYLDASINLAVALAQSGNTEEAISLLTAAIQAHSGEDHTDNAYVNLGTAYMHRGEWDAAEDAYQHALYLNPNLAFARQSISNIEAHRQAQQ